MDPRELVLQKRKEDRQLMRESFVTGA